MAAIEFLRFLDRSHPFRQIEHRHAIFTADMVLVVMVMVDLGSVRAHRRVAVNGYIGNLSPLAAVGTLPHPNLIKAHVKSSDTNHAAESAAPVDDFGPLALTIVLQLSNGSDRRYAI